MRLCRFELDGSPRLGIGAGNLICDAVAIYEKAGARPPDCVLDADMRSLCYGHDGVLAFLNDYILNATHIGPANERTTHDARAARILAPLPNPRKFFCVGLNYRDHCEEQKVEPPKSPVLFAKFPNAVSGHGDKVLKPAITQKMDYEGELGVVIGKGGKNIRREEALKYVFGYTIVNDISARDIQKADGQWLRAKSQDGFAPTGPYIVTTDEIRDPQVLNIRTTVNGRVMQDSNTAKMIFGVAELIEFITQGITLEPGDIISTGTPHGVGQYSNPQVFLKGGDKVEIEIERIGLLASEIVE
jgi:2-keto-4-pentenoate hydratase/2-oxohepta-3-ene-1,7-dioic acid hydratase in catechol pathway